MGCLNSLLAQREGRQKIPFAGRHVENNSPLVLEAQSPARCLASETPFEGQRREPFRDPLFELVPKNKRTFERPREVSFRRLLGFVNKNT